MGNHHNKFNIKSPKIIKKEPFKKKNHIETQHQIISSNIKTSKKHRKPFKIEKKKKHPKKNPTSNHQKKKHPKRNLTNNSTTFL